MPNQENRSSGDEGFLGAELENQLKQMFEGLPHSIPLFLFTRKGDNDVLNQAAREVIKAFRQPEFD